MEKILIIRFSSIGDIVLTSPVIRCIKKQKNIRIHYLVKLEYKILLDSNPHIEKVFSFNHNLNQLITDLKSEKYDLIIDLQHNLRSWWIKFNLSSPSYSFNKKNWKKYLLIYGNWNLLNNHVVDRYFEVVKHINITNDNHGLEYFFHKNTRIDFDLDQVFIAWSIGGSSIKKQLSKKQIIDVCNSIHHPVVLLGGVSEKTFGSEIVQESDHQKIYNFCGQTDLDQSAYIIKYSSLVLSNDTGLMHIAAAFKKPIISFWGCTKPSLGFSPYMSSSRSRELITNKSDMPCSRHGHYCRFKGDGCVKEISSKIILQSISIVFN